jgi:predicted phage terminase large subunit-like protein
VSWKLARSSPGALGVMDSGGPGSGWFKLPPHVRLMDGKLLDLANPKHPLKRLMVFMPPRHGKSYLSSLYLPAWFLGTFPDKRVMLTGYGSDFAETWGGRARNVLEAHGQEVWGVSVSRDSAAKSRWDIEGRRGGMIATGIGGSLTGRGADLLILDDVVKSHEEAHSEVMRQSVWDWFLSTAYTRLEPDGAVLIVMTRWHEDDLAGRLLAEAEDEEDEDAEGEAWEVLSFPALAEEAERTVLPGGKVWTRQPGEALWPERYDEAALRRIRKRQTAYWFGAMYQQRPSPEGGHTFRREWFKYFDQQDGWYLIPREEGGLPYRVKPVLNPSVSVTRFCTVDLATSTKETADYTVIATWDLLDTPNGKYLLLLDVDRRRLEGPDIVPALKSANAKWRPGPIYVESGGFQTAIVQAARRAGLVIRELKAETDKLTRSVLAQAGLENGRIFFRSGASWLADFEDELLMFPNGKHDDQVDVLSYAARIMGLSDEEDRGGVSSVPGFLNRVAGGGGGRRRQTGQYPGGERRVA